MVSIRRSKTTKEEVDRVVARRLKKRIL